MADIVIRTMDRSDPEPLSAAFVAVRWVKSPDLFRGYVADHDEGRRIAFVGLWRENLAGYVTVLWASDYPPFAEHHIPEVSDLNVLPEFRRRGIGSALLDHAESAAATRSPTVGIGVGLYADYGAAQRIYVRRGYVPDGRGIMYDNRAVTPGAEIRIDDHATLMLTRQLR